MWFTNFQLAQAAKYWVALDAFSHFIEATAGSFFLSQEERGGGDLPPLTDHKDWDVTV